MLELDASGHPYLRLPAPHNTITLTAYRPEDADVLIAMLNHPAVYTNLAGPPFPFLRQHHDAKVVRLENDTVTARHEFGEITELNQRSTSVPGDAECTAQRWVSALPFTVIRDGDAAIGDLVLRRSDFWDIDDKSERAEVKQRNDELNAGDPDIIWETGFSLIPSMHGRGIMTAVLRTLTHDWLVPYMNVHHLSGCYLEHNPASRRVFEKCGWRHITFLPHRIDLSSSKIVEATTENQYQQEENKTNKVGMGVMRWDRGREGGLEKNGQI